MRYCLLDGELEAKLYFHYDQNKIPIAPAQLTYEHTASFVTPSGIVARNLVDERKLTEELFQDFIFNTDEGSFISKSEKKIVEFMTDVIPRHAAPGYVQLPPKSSRSIHL